jgi:uncharacterized membrane protein YeaQ/YmgE (transglycosylase-associated protein family)
MRIKIYSLRLSLSFGVVYGLGFIGWLIVGIIAGWTAGHLTRGRGFGIIGNIVVGVIGAIIGGFIFGLFGLSSTVFTGSLVTAIVGAVVLLYIASWITKR